MKLFNLVALFLATILFLGCGSTFDESPTLSTNTTGPAQQPTEGRALLATEGGVDLLASIDALGPERAETIYGAVGSWSNSNFTLTGSIQQAVVALAVIVRAPNFGATALFDLIGELQPRPGQGLIVAFGQTLAPGDPAALARAADSLTALRAAPIPSPGPVAPIIAAHLEPAFANMAEFHATRILAPEAMPPGKRAALQDLRFKVPGSETGQIIQKVIRVSDMQSYLDGTFDPEVGGSISLKDQVAFLITPAELIAGLRLDYPGGFQGQTRVAELLFPQTDDFEIFIPFSVAMGGVVGGDYPFTGTGFTSNTDRQVIPEFHMPLGERVPLPQGSQLLLILENGESLLQATINENGEWDRIEQTTERRPSRRKIAQKASYKGTSIWVSSTDEVDYWVTCEQREVPSDLFKGMRQIGPKEFFGRISVDDPELFFE